MICIRKIIILQLDGTKISQMVDPWAQQWVKCKTKKKIPWKIVVRANPSYPHNLFHILSNQFACASSSISLTFLIYVCELCWRTNYLPNIFIQLVYSIWYRHFSVLNCLPLILPISLSLSLTHSLTVFLLDSSLYWYEMDAFVRRYWVDVLVCAWVVYHVCMSVFVCLYTAKAVAIAEWISISDLIQWRVTHSVTHIGHAFNTHVRHIYQSSFVPAKFVSKTKVAEK